MGRADVVIDILVNANQAAGDLDQTASRMDRFQSGLGKLAVPAAAVGVALVAMGKQATDAASAAQQSMGAVETVFGSASGAVTAYAATSAQDVGLASSAYNQLAAEAGATMQSMGLSQDQAAASTGDMISLAADLAATMGGTTTDAVNALTSALKGEADPAEALGLNLKDSAVKAQMAADGTDKLTGSAYDAAKAAAILALAHKQAGAATGAFARESDTAAGSSQIAAASFEDAQAALGESLLPVIVFAAQAFADLTNWMKENSQVVLIVAAVLGTLAAAILVVNGAMAAFNFIMAANPVVLVIIAIAALVAGIVVLWNTSDGFRAAVIGMWEAISGAAITAWNAISSAASAVWNAITGVITGAVSVVTNLFNSLKSLATGVWTSISSAASSAWNSISSTVAAVIGGIGSIINSLLATASAAWNGIKSAGEAVFNSIRSIATSAISAISGIIDSLVSTASSAFNAIKSIGSSVWSAISSAAQSALNLIMGPINVVKNAIQSIMSAIQGAIDFASNLASKIASLPVIGGLFGADAPPAATAYWTPAAGLASRGLLTAPVATATSGSGTTIVIQGALDPVAVARQVRSVLAADDRRRHGVRLLAPSVLAAR